MVGRDQCMKKFDAKDFDFRFCPVSNEEFLVGSDNFRFLNGETIGQP